MKLTLLFLLVVLLNIVGETTAWWHRRHHHHHHHHHYHIGHRFNRRLSRAEYNIRRIWGSLRNLYRRVYRLEHSHHWRYYHHYRHYRGHFKDCYDIKRHYHHARSGVYTIRPARWHAIRVYCDMHTNGGGWTVFQRRINGRVNFYRNWHSYRQGFGNLHGDFWLGLDNIHALTRQRRYKLRVDMRDFRGHYRYAVYRHFRVANVHHAYRLTVGGYHGNAGNALTYHNGARFSTYDRDYDTYGKNCARIFHGAWWYKSCHYANLNGKYFRDYHRSFANGVNWYQFRGYHHSLKWVAMKVRPW